MARKVLPVLAALLLVTAAIAPAVGAAPPCGRKNCKDNIAVCQAREGCAVLGGKQRAQCNKACVALVLDACNAGLCDCTTPSNDCSPSGAFVEAGAVAELLR